MEDELEGFLFGVTATICVLLVGSMMAFGPHILEWLDAPEQA